MTVMTKSANGWRDTFESFHRARREDLPAWALEIREQAIEKFEKLGFPTLRHEDWRFTDVSPITDTTFGIVNGSEPAPAPGRIESFHLADLDGPRLVFVDGRFCAELSSLDGAGPGVIVAPLARALAEHEDLVRRHLSRVIDPGDEAFTELNTAFLEDGLFVHAERNAAPPEAIHVLWVSTAPSEARMTHPRALVIAEEGAQLSVIEDHVSLGDTKTFTNSVTEVVARENADVHHHFIERQNDRACTIRAIYADQARNSRFTSHSVLFGGALVRNNVFPSLNGENCHTLLNGLYVPRGTQIQDNRMRVRHAEPHGESRQHYKGILRDRARAMFSGRIIVDEDAQKTDAVQTNMNMLLSDEALVETKPQLEIYADDVKCTHGATVGQIDDEAIFYCRARGIDKATARSLLVFAFANEILERIEVLPLRDRLHSLLEERLGRNGPGGP